MRSPRRAATTALARMPLTAQDDATGSLFIVGKVSSEAIAAALYGAVCGQVDPIPIPLCFTAAAPCAGRSPCCAL